MPNHPECWEGSPEFELDEPEHDESCQNCGWPLDRSKDYAAVWIEGVSRPCDPCNGWEDVE